MRTGVLYGGEGGEETILHSLTNARHYTLIICSRTYRMVRGFQTRAPS